MYKTLELINKKLNWRNARESNFDSPNVLEKLEERLHRDFAKVANE